MLGVRSIEPLGLVGVSPFRPSCRLVTSAKFVEFGNHLIPQPCRKLGIQHDGIANRRCLMRPLDRRPMINPSLNGIEPAIGGQGSGRHGSPRAFRARWLRLRCWCDEIRRIEIVFPGNANKREQGVASGVPTMAYVQKNQTHVLEQPPSSRPGLTRLRARASSMTRIASREVPYRQRENRNGLDRVFVTGGDAVRAPAQMHAK